jgi:L-threonylcarbamoyladenylate synthase
MTAPALPRIVPDDDAGRSEAIRVLAAGGIVALPTDTVYGLAVDLASPGGIDRLFAAKRRPSDRAVMLLLADSDQAGGLVDWPPSAAALAKAFWPGGLTIVVAQRPDAGLPSELTGGRSTVGLRLPDHSSPRALAASLGPLPVTSANVSGLPEAAGADEIRSQLGEAVDLILDGGPAHGGPPSTVVDCSSPTPRILREGAIGADAIRRTLAQAGLAAPEP